MLLKDKVALITGSSRGIGAATAELYAAQGAKVVVNYVSNQNAALEVVARIESAGGTAIAAELGGAESGASVLASALGDREETLVHGLPFDEREARVRAESTFRMMARRFVVARGVAQPDARLRVGAFVDLQGLGPLFTGRYYLSAVRHLFDAQGG
ncbi:MAG: SDR family NAD(P)-dependent oxidoreductase, partial [Syntrophobacteraceae bacterium]|nr:SDR family NAD(P)-dependent oxidoreductase [Syntrophobacteraceae bacterium]